MSDQETRDRRAVKVRKTPKHYGKSGGAHGPKKGGAYKRPQNSNWSDQGGHYS